jgi:hypothetical protein
MVSETAECWLNMTARKAAHHGLSIVTLCRGGSLEHGSDRQLHASWRQALGRLPRSAANTADRDVISKIVQRMKPAITPHLEKRDGCT